MRVIENRIMSVSVNKSTLELLLQNVDHALSKVEYSVTCVAKDNGIISEIGSYEKVIMNNNNNNY